MSAGEIVAVVLTGLLCLGAVIGLVAVIRGQGPGE